MRQAKSSTKLTTPFRLGTRTTTLYKVVPNEDPENMLDSFEAIGEIVWHMIGPSTMRLHGEEMKTNKFIPRKGVFWGWVYRALWFRGLPGSFG